MQVTEVAFDVVFFEQTDGTRYADLVDGLQVSVEPDVVGDLPRVDDGLIQKRLAAKSAQAAALE